MRGETQPQDASASVRELSALERVSREKRQLYEFGPFLLDPAERTLPPANQIVPLTPKAFGTLLVLARNSGHLPAKDELITMLRPGTFGEEGSLSNNIFVLRKVLGADTGFIETVPARPARCCRGSAVNGPPRS